MLLLQNQYAEFIARVRTMREKLRSMGRAELLEDYLNHLYRCQEEEHYLCFEDKLDEPMFTLRQKCMAILQNRKLGNDTWFSRLMRGYIQAHPLDEFTQITQCQIYCWTLFPAYYQYLTESMEDTPEYQRAFGRQYRQLCDLLGADEMERLVQLFEACFGAISGRMLMWRACCDHLLHVLMERTEDSSQRLHELFLDRPELLDYPWVEAYMEAHQLKAAP